MTECVNMREREREREICQGSFVIRPAGYREKKGSFFLSFVNFNGDFKAVFVFTTLPLFHLPLTV